MADIFAIKNGLPSTPVTTITDSCSHLRVKGMGDIERNETTPLRIRCPYPGGIVPAFTPPPLPSDDKRWKIVNGTMRRNGFARHALIETLHTVQSSFGYLDDDAIRFVARSLRVPLSQAYGVVTFYHYFSLKPPGKHTATICIGTACYIKGADKLVEAAEKRLGVPQGQTTNDGQISLMTARCVGACSRAPVVLYDGEVVGEMTPELVLEQLERWAVE
jgi:bidirectional [NiFe] hydrogenase diaphorase subunit